MSLQTLIYAKLIANTSAGATNPVVVLVGTRITPDIRGATPTLPALIYSVSQDNTQQALTSASHFVAEVETLAISRTKGEAQSISKAVFGQLERFIGTDASTSILSCIHSRATNGYLSPVAGENFGVFTESDIFTVIYQNL